MDARAQKTEDVAHGLPRRREVPDKKVPGLRLRIGKQRSTWVLVCRLGHHPSRHTLGHYPAMSRAEARAKALSWKAALASGKDPSLRYTSAGKTFGDICEEYFRDTHRRGLRRAYEVERDMRRDFKSWWHRPISAIARQDVLHLVRDVLDRSSWAAHHAFSYASRVFAWAIEQGLIEHSPCHGLRPSRLIGEKPARERVLTDGELRALWVSGDAFVRLLMLTGQRRSEVAGMRWSEINGDVWTIPPERHKSKRAHVVPLVHCAVDILDQLPRLDDRVFRLGSFDRFKKKIDAAIPTGEPWVLHDIRRTVRTHLSALAPVDIAERVIGHALQGVRRTYDRYDYLQEKRRALELWADRLMGIVGVYFRKP